MKGKVQKRRCILKRRLPHTVSIAALYGPLWSLEGNFCSCFLESRWSGSEEQCGSYPASLPPRQPLSSFLQLGVQCSVDGAHAIVLG